MDEATKRLLDCPAEILVLVASALAASPKSLLAFGATAHSLKALLLHGDEASMLWDAASVRQFGPSAPILARRASGSDETGGIAAYRAALRLRDEVADCVEIVEGSVTANVAGMGVVACPCLESLQNYGIGAQGAVRRAAGPSFEHSLYIENVSRLPLARLSTTLVPGGALAPGLVAMVVTTPPEEAWPPEEQHDPMAWQAAVSSRLHANLFAAMRAAGRASVVMPTLGTGGAGLDVRAVCDGLATALAQDLRMHPHAPLLLRVACYERSHSKHVREAKAKVLECLFDDFVEASANGAAS